MKVAYTRVELVRFATGIALGADRFGRGAEALEKMAAAWRTDSALRDHVQELFDRRQSENRVNGRTKPWAATRFDKENITGDGRRAEPRSRSRSDATTTPGRDSGRRRGRTINEAKKQR